MSLSRFPEGGRGADLGRGCADEGEDGGERQGEDDEPREHDDLCVRGISRMGETKGSGRARDKSGRSGKSGEDATRHKGVSSPYLLRASPSLGSAEHRTCLTSLTLQPDGRTVESSRRIRMTRPEEDRSEVTWGRR